MAKFKDFDESKIVDYSLDDLKGFVSEIEMMKSVINQKLADEIANEFKDVRFDIYSSRGTRKIKNISKKYAGSLTGADSYLRTIKDEIKKREQYEEELRYSGRSVKKHKEISTEEFLKKEEDKTWAYRSKIE